MSFEVTIPERGVTSPTVTLELDANTCSLFSALFLELGHALEQAGRRYKARKRHEESPSHAPGSTGGSAGLHEGQNAET